MSQINGNRVATTFALVWLSLATVTLAMVSTDLPIENSVDYKEWQAFKEFQELQTWKAQRERRRFEEAAREFNWKMYQRKGQDPPLTDQVALMARYIVNQANWTSVATISTRTDTLSYPFANLVSFSDGTLGNGTGIPYLFMIGFDFTAQDIVKDNRATLMMTLAQGGWCHYKDYDPMDPRCARVILSGQIKAVNEDDPEFPIAQSAVFGRHPELAHVPAGHHCYFAKLNISTIVVLDSFGGPGHVSIEDYMNPPSLAGFAGFGARHQVRE